VYSGSQVSRVVTPHPTDLGPERLAAIVRSTDDAVTALDMDGVVTDWNEASAHLYGYPAEEMVGRPASTIVPPGRYEEDAEMVRRVLSGERIEQFETERLRRDGSRVAVSLTVSPMLDPSGAVVGASIIARDISARRAAEADRSQLAALVACSADAIIATDVGFRITSCNAAAAELYRIPCDEMIGRVATEISESTLDRDERMLLMRRALAGETVSSEGVHRRHDGSEFVLAGTAAPIRTASGEIVGVVTIVRDVTSEWQARSSLQRDERRARLLADASSALDRSLQAPHVVSSITRLVVPELADICAVATADHEAGSTELVDVAAVDPAVGDLMRRALSWLALTDRPLAASRPALHAGEDVLLDPPPSELLESFAAADPELRDGLAALTLTSVMIVPLRSSGRTLGLMLFVSLSPQRRFDRDALGLAREVADRVAQALENARLLASAQRAQAAAEVAAHELRAAQRRFASAFANAPIGMALVSARDGLASRIDDVNPAFCDLTGFAQDELRGRDLIEMLVHPSNRVLATHELEQLVSGALDVINGERRLVRNGGEDVWVQISVAPLGLAGGASELVVQVQDISERKRHEGELRYLADHDPLTGLVNRRRFVEELGRMAANAYRHGVATAVLVLDVDHFKYVNDTYGHATGDDVLTAVARMLMRRTRDTDVIGRLGGDEFGIILTHSSGKDARSVAQSLLDELREDRSTVVNDQPIAVTASIGVRALERGDGLTADELIVEADIAMYDAKENGRNRISLAGSDSIEPTRLRRRLAMSDRIRRALARDDGFELFEQPIRALASDEVDRTEILLRMPDGEGDLLPPSSFLPIADHFGLMPALDQWVIVHAIELLAERQQAGIQLGMEVNLSGTSIGDPAVIDFIAESVRGARIDPTALIFEVTETEAIVNIDRARVLSRQLSSLGCKFALDDFGAGFGSFYYLKHLPFDVVKIDGDFIKSLPTSTSDQLTVQAIVTIARGLSKRTVAEFVGNERTVEMLREYGVDFAQGYHIGKPAPATLVPAGMAPR
jgi:diguanylate cyclase (GGDEF)-like protein/PAS domain S-box-containing protein